MAFPLKSQPPPQDTTPIPSRQKLELYLKNGIDFVDTAQTWIDKFKLPYTILEGVADGKVNVGIFADVPIGERFWFIKDTLCPGELHLGKFITVHDETLEMKEKALKASKVINEVLIYGPTGTGKEIIAKSQIYNRTGHTRAINCAAMPENLIEAELFGYVRGAFTGAESTRNGLVIDAANGVMFLDEVGELPLPMQAKLLRILQERTIRKVGGKDDEEITCKFVFATNKNLEKMVEHKTFREDLYARISTLSLSIQSLSNRKCDIVPICKSLQGGEAFLKEYGEHLENGSLQVPYNVRSLQQYIVRYSVWGCIN